MVLLFFPPPVCFVRCYGADCWLSNRSIIRILWMIPIYSVVAWLSIYFYRKSVYFGVLGDCYEAFTIAAFFSLLCYYIAPDLHMQKDYFRAIKPKSWVWPLTWLARCCGGERGCWRTPRSGLTWFNVRETIQLGRDCLDSRGSEADTVSRSFGSAFFNIVSRESP